MVNPGTLLRELRRMGGDEMRSAWADDQPALVGVAHGVPTNLDGRDYQNRAASLGNSVVPQVVEMIGRAIMEADA